MGLLITLEGGEGAGKSTLQAALAKQLVAVGQVCFCTREPGGTPLGTHLRSWLLHAASLSPTAELLLYAADRAEHVSQVIQPRLAAGEVVLCDRHTDSTVAYQGYGRGLDLNLIHQLNGVATQGLVPDCTFWLDVPVAVGLRRVQGRSPQLDRFEQTEIAFHERLATGFRNLAQAHPQRIVRLDGTASPAEVAAAAWDYLLKRWPDRFSPGSR